MHENECDAREKHTHPPALEVNKQGPRAFYFHMRAQRCLKYRVSEQGRIHALFAIFFNQRFSVALAGNIFFVTLAVFPKLRLVPGGLFFFLTLPSFFFPKFSTLVQAILVFFTLNAGDADHDRYPC